MNCTHCGKYIHDDKRSDTKYCSHKCRQRAWRARGGEKQKITKGRKEHYLQQAHQIMELRAEGWSWKRIAKALGRDKNNVRRSGLWIAAKGNQSSSGQENSSGEQLEKAPEDS